jgi:hypothetical protein
MLKSMRAKIRKSLVADLQPCRSTLKLRGGPGGATPNKKKAEVETPIAALLYVSENFFRHLHCK